MKALLQLQNFLIFTIVATFPLYFFDSGSMQVSHYFVLLFAATVFFHKDFIITNRSYFILLISLFSLMLCRQFIFLLEYNSINLLDPLFFLFNIILFFAMGSYLRANHSDFSNFLKYAVYASILMVFIGFYFTGLSLVNTADSFEGISHFTNEGVRYRSIGTFNNPNQLGYFSVCIAGIASYLFLINKIKFAEFLILIILILVMVAASLSKAAMVSVLFYGLIFVDKKFYKFLILVLGILSLLLIIFFQFYDIADVKFVNRLLTIGNTTDDNLIGRGYGPLLNPDLRLLYGWGGGYSELQINHEVHSTLGNLLISYGLTGLILFLSLLAIIFLRLKMIFGLMIAAALMLPTILYGLTHNGLRFSIFWVLLSVLSFMPDLNNKSITMYYNYDKKNYENS